MPVIRIDEEVWNWLKSLAEPLEDTPNSVLRRLARLSQGPLPAHSSIKQELPTENQGERKAGRGLSRRPTSSIKTGFGRDLNKQFGVGAEHALYSATGDWYEELRDFPGALFDASGYVLFRTEQEYQNMPGLRHGSKLTVKDGISSLPGYIRTSATK